MILAVHILTGAAVGLLLQNYWLTFIAVFVLHFILDAIPHYEYDIEAIKIGKLDKKYIVCLLKPLIDLSIGSMLVLAFIRQPDPAAFMAVGAIGALLPDALSAFYWKTKLSFLKPIVDFHRFKVHPKNNKNTPPLKGIFTQIIASAAAISLLVFFG